MPAIEPATSEETASAASLDVASRLPLVRVVMRPEEPRPSEREDVFLLGVLRPSHKSRGSREVETALGWGDALYFHLGRPDPAYGAIVLVFQELPTPQAGARQNEATPFALGQLGCSEERHIEWRDKNCLQPIAHEPLRIQRAFLEASNWVGEFKPHVARFLDRYFAPDYSKYFQDYPQGRPTVRDPDGVFSHPNNRSWHGWTVEVRAFGEVDLHAALELGLIRAWGAAPDYVRHLQEEALELGGGFVERLLQTPMQPVPLTDPRLPFKVISDAIRDEVLS